MTAKAAEIVGRTLNASRAGYGEMDRTGAFLTIPEDWAVPGETRLIGRRRLADDGTIGPGLERGESLVVSDVRTDSRTEAHVEPFTALNICAMLNVPVRERGRTVGLLFVHSPTPRAWAPEEIAFARNVADRVQVGIARLRADEVQATLNRELSHRLKNTLAMVQAIATQTLRNAVDLEAARDALGARLLAMGKAHDLLLTGARESASLEDVVRGALTVHDDAQNGRLRVSVLPCMWAPGPPCRWRSSCTKTGDQRPQVRGALRVPGLRVGVLGDRRRGRGRDPPLALERAGRSPGRRPAAARLRHPADRARAGGRVRRRGPPDLRSRGRDLRVDGGPGRARSRGITPAQDTSVPRPADRRLHAP